MTQCEIWDNHSDSPTINRVADTTSGNWASRLVNEYEVRRRKE